MSRFGWIPDLPDGRDHLLSIAPQQLAELPSSSDLRANMPPVQDQGELGSCTAHAVGSMHQYNQILQDQEVFTPSRLFLYYNARILEGTTRWDSGASIRDAVKAMVRWGACNEDDWDYKIASYNLRPYKSNYNDGLRHQAVAYKRLPRSLDVFKRCLADGKPFVFGFTVYTSFVSAGVDATGVVPMPVLWQEKVLGGHAVLAVGYDDSESNFIVRNSWGKEWGSDGYFYMPYDYLMSENLSDDFWVVSWVE